jgi:hypothetical protein
MKSWDARLPEMILYYSVAGAAFGGDDVAYSIVRRVRRGQPLPPRSRKTWQDATKLAGRICGQMATNPVDWFTGESGDIVAGWRALDDIHGIGPKIASFILRDLSFMRDYSSGDGSRSLRYRRSRDRGWYEELSPEMQSLFIPIDIHVHRGAKTVGVATIFNKYSAYTIQADVELYQRAATKIVRWARAHAFDPRGVDIYWFGVGAGYLDPDGRERDP